MLIHAPHPVYAMASKLPPYMPMSRRITFPPIGLGLKIGRGNSFWNLTFAEVLNYVEWDLLVERFCFAFVVPLHTTTRCLSWGIGYIYGTK